jgi:thioesterase domain-containing protein
MFCQHQRPIGKCYECTQYDSISKLQAENAALLTENNALKEQVQEQAAEIERLKTTTAHMHQDLHCVASDLADQVREATRQRDETMQDAANWRRYQKRKQEVIDAGMGRKILRDAAIKGSKS